jgi:sugar/nucleoside kinase (ribokinase family)
MFRQSLAGARSGADQTLGEVAADRLAPRLGRAVQRIRPDRVGGGDGFASGLAYAFLEGRGPQEAVELGATHGALVMTTPGDTSMATLAEVEAAKDRLYN